MRSGHGKVNLSLTKRRDSVPVVASQPITSTGSRCFAGLKQEVQESKQGVVVATSDNVNIIGPNDRYVASVATTCRCGREIYRRHQGGKFCVLHWRIRAMRNSSRTNQKYIPSVAEIEAIIPESMLCPKCGRRMFWTQSHGDAALTLSLQHNLDGSIGILCRSCNAREDDFPNGTFMKVPLDLKFCAKCLKLFPLCEFQKHGSADKWNGLGSYCKPCHRQRTREAHHKARSTPQGVEHNRQYQRNYRLRRKLEGRPILRKKVTPNG